MYDSHSKWYTLKGKGFWCVLFLLLFYLIAFVIAVAVVVAGVVCYILMKLEEACDSCKSESAPERPDTSSSGGVPCIPILIPVET